MKFRSILIASLLGVLPTLAAAEGKRAQWVQYGPNGLEARAIVPPDASCPQIKLDDQAAEHMNESDLPGDGDFLNRTCRKEFKAAHHAEVLGTPLSVFAPEMPSRIVVLGDTGCRIETGKPGKQDEIQDCYTQWPLAAIVAEIAEMVPPPDLVIHVGDYYYRESRCPGTEAKNCDPQGPYADTLDTWFVDFFDPVAPLLAKVPWIFVRGNHEACPRGVKGWARFLSPVLHAPSEPCSETSDRPEDPYVVAFSKLSLTVVDDATADEKINRQHETWRKYVDRYDEVVRKIPSPTVAGDNWLLMHRPIAALKTIKGAIAIGNPLLLQTTRDVPWDRYSLLLSGHIHAFEAITYHELLPPQLVVGNGGDRLDQAPVNVRDFAYPVPKDDKQKGGKIADSFVLPGFGFTSLVRRDEGWHIAVHSVDGRPRHACYLRNRQLSCR